MKYGWSNDEEHFTGDFDTREEALAEATADNALLPGARVWTCEKHECTAGDFFSVDNFADDIGEQAYEECGEVAEDWPGLDEDAKQKLHELIAAFINEHSPCSFWRADKIEEHIVP